MKYISGLIKIDGIGAMVRRGLTAMWNRATLSQHSTAQHSTG